MLSAKPLLVLPPFPAAVTAVAWAPHSTHSAHSAQGPGARYVLAAGLETGQLQLWAVWRGGAGGRGGAAAALTAACVWSSGTFDSCAAQVGPGVQNCAVLTIDGIYTF